MCMATMGLSKLPTSLFFSVLFQEGLRNPIQLQPVEEFTNSTPVSVRPRPTQPCGTTLLPQHQACTWYANTSLCSPARFLRSIRPLQATQHAAHECALCSAQKQPKTKEPVNATTLHSLTLFCNHHVSYMRDLYSMRQHACLVSMLTMPAEQHRGGGRPTTGTWPPQRPPRTVPQLCPRTGPVRLRVSGSPARSNRTQSTNCKEKNCEEL
jgi:hypothetical protein